MAPTSSAGSADDAKVVPMTPDSRIFVAGHRGLVGSAIVRRLQRMGCRNLILKTRTEVDLRDQGAVREFFKAARPEFVFLAAAKVGGIHANNRLRGDFILENLEIQTNVVGEAFRQGIEKLLFMGSSCIYPRLAPQPIPESALLSGPLEITNDAYAVAKIAGLMLCKSLRMQYGRRFVSVMPTNVYGPGDNYDPENSHVLPGLIRKFHEAKTGGAPFVTAWGTGKPLREFIYSDDLADAAVFSMQRYEGEEHINVGTGHEISIRDLTELVKKTVGFTGEIRWDPTKPDGTPRKLLNSDKLFALGWRPQTDLPAGVALAYRDFAEHL